MNFDAPFFNNSIFGITLGLVICLILHPMLCGFIWLILAGLPSLIFFVLFWLISAIIIKPIFAIMHVVPILGPFLAFVISLFIGIPLICLIFTNLFIPTFFLALTIITGA